MKSFLKHFGNHLPLFRDKVSIFGWRFSSELSKFFSTGPKERFRKTICFELYMFISFSLWSSKGFLNFGNKNRHGWKNGILLVQRNFAKTLNFGEKLATVCYEYWEKYFRNFRNFFGRVRNIASYQSSELFEENIAIKNYSSLVFCHFERRISGLLKCNFWQCCQDCTSFYVYGGSFWVEKIFSQKALFKINFGLRAIVSIFWQFLSSILSRLNSTYPEDLLRSKKSNKTRNFLQLVKQFILGIRQMLFAE